MEILLILFIVLIFYFITNPDSRSVADIYYSHETQKIKRELDATPKQEVTPLPKPKPLKVNTGQVKPKPKKRKVVVSKAKYTEFVDILQAIGCNKKESEKTVVNILKKEPKITKEDFLRKALR